MTDAARVHLMNEGGFRAIEFPRPTGGHTMAYSEQRLVSTMSLIATGLASIDEIPSGAS